jgi:hypothetical protein
LSAIVLINGSKPGVWNHPAPFDADDRYEPFRENVPLSAWAMPYNQRDLLNSPDFAGFQPPAMIVDSNCDEAAIAKVMEAWPDNPESEFPGLPALLAKVQWALLPANAENTRALFATSNARSDFVGLLQHWCHENGRGFYTVSIQDGKPIVNAYPASAERRRDTIYNEGSQFLTRMATYGIPAEETLSQLQELIQQLKLREEQ